MKAGHFSLNLLPKPLTSWPTLGPLAWHVVGVGGCCEVQCEGRVAWKAHNRLVDRSTDVDGDLNMVVHYIPEFFSSSSSWQLEDDAQSLRDLPDRFAMATSSAADGCQEDLALEGSDAVVGATSIPALPARALAGGHECGGVEDPAQGHGATQGVAEAMVAEGPGGDESFAPSRGSDASQPHGLGGGVHGRRGRDVRDQGTEETSPCSEASCTSSGYAPSNRRAGGPEGRTRQRASRTPRRDASRQGRPGQAGGSPERDRGPQGHQRPVEGQVQAMVDVLMGKALGSSPERSKGSAEGSDLKGPMTGSKAMEVSAPTGPTAQAPTLSHLQVPWGLPMNPDGQVHFDHFNPQTRSVQEGWVLTPQFYQLNETDDQML